MKNKLFGNNIDLNCEYCNNWELKDEDYSCKFGKQINDKGKCRKFNYNPLKRIPYRKPNLPEYDPSEFSL